MTLVQMDKIAKIAQRVIECPESLENFRDQYLIPAANESRPESISDDALTYSHVGPQLYPFAKQFREPKIIWRPLDKYDEDSWNDLVRKYTGPLTAKALNDAKDKNRSATIRRFKATYAWMVEHAPNAAENYYDVLLELWTTKHLDKIATESKTLELFPTFSTLHSRNNSAVIISEKPDTNQNFEQGDDTTNMALNLNEPSSTHDNISSYEENFASLDEKFAKTLHGNDVITPLRELLKNAADAVRLRALLENRNPDWGEIKVRTGNDKIGDYIEIEDNGCGMSKSVLTRFLLQSDQSYWKSEKFKADYGFAISKSFKPRSACGFGFCSVAIWGKIIRIQTRKYDRDSPLLTLETGTDSQSKSTYSQDVHSNLLPDGGTCIRVWLKTKISDMTFEYGQGYYVTFLKNIEEFILWLCPTLDVNVMLESKIGSTKKLISANDWTALDSIKLLERVWVGRGWSVPRGEWLNRIAKALQPIRTANNQTIARAALAPFRKNELAGAICDDGFRVGVSHFVAGVVPGKHSDVVDKEFAVGLTESELRQWLSQQPEFWKLESTVCLAEDVQFARVIHKCGINTDPLIIAKGNKGYLSVGNIRKMDPSIDEIQIVPYRPRYGEATIYEFEYKLNLLDNSLLMLGGFLKEHEKAIQEFVEIYNIKNELPLYKFQDSLVGAVIVALAEVWNTTVQAIESASFRENRPVGTINNSTFSCSAIVLQRP